MLPVCQAVLHQTATTIATATIGRKAARRTEAASNSVGGRSNIAAVGLHSTWDTSLSVFARLSWFAALAWVASPRTRFAAEPLRFIGVTGMPVPHADVS